MKAFFLIILSLSSFTFYSQNCISGYLNLENTDPVENEVILSTISLNDTNHETIIATSQIKKNGFFSFKQNLFDKKNKIYKIEVARLKIEQRKKLQEKLKSYKLFILSKKDIIHFKGNSKLFGDYTTSNKADKEWQKLRAFEAKYKENNLNSDEYLEETKKYTKDSLQILLVKLISIKKLDEKNLLSKDIKENTKYYSDLLQELRASDLDPSTYYYLENKFNLLTQKVASRNYTTSLLINGISFLIVIILIIVIYRLKRNNKTTPSLSKQEQTIKTLIVNGKSNKEIAGELFISLSTVKTHITNIYSKLNISNREELLLRK